MYQAKLLKLNQLIEEEVTISINGVEIVGFANNCHEIILNNSYLVNIHLTFLNGSELLEKKEKKYGLRRLNDSYRYLLNGKVCGTYIDIGNGIKIEDDIFKEHTYLEGCYIEMKVDRLSVEFV